MSENNQMPSMPVAPVSSEEVKPSEDKPSNEVSLPGEKEIEGDVKPEYNTPEDNSSSEVKVPLTAKTGIEVVATRKGFYAQQRYREGNKFVVKRFSSLGEWMKCIDPALERERAKHFSDKKLAIKKAKLERLEKARK